MSPVAGMVRFPGPSAWATPGRLLIAAPMTAMFLFNDVPVGLVGSFGMVRVFSQWP
jgi:hypothetical protein